VMNSQAKNACLWMRHLPCWLVLCPEKMALKFEQSDLPRGSKG